MDDHLDKLRRKLAETALVYIHAGNRAMDQVQADCPHRRQVCYAPNDYTLVRRCVVCGQILEHVQGALIYSD